MSQSIDEQWTPQMLQDLDSIRGAVIDALVRAGLPSEVEDLMQDTFLIATRRLDTYDQELGSFRNWLIGIAYQRMRDMVKHDNVKTNVIERLRQDARHTHQLNNDPHADVFATAIASRVDTAYRLSEVLSLVAVAVEEEALFLRSMALLRDYEGNVQEAALAMGISASALRDSHRQVLDMAQVVDKALSLYRYRSENQVETPLSVGELLSCFPDPEETSSDRAWLRKVPLAVFRAGGWSAPKRELIAAVSFETGYNTTTSRHAVARCSRLFMVARTIAETGEL